MSQNVQSIDTIGIVGAGNMGRGIAQSLATHGYTTILNDLEESILSDARQHIRGSLQKLAESKNLDESDQQEIIERITTTTNLHDLSESDLVIEAVVEDASIKKNVFEQLSDITTPNTLLASNTSSISITELASATDRPDHFVGLHFFSPVPMMRLVEIVRGLETSDKVLSLSRDLTESINKTPVTVEDSPGFVSNRILAPMLNEACYALMEGVADKEDIDTVMKLGMNHPMGPLKLTDAVGLDVILDVLEVLHEDLGDDKYRPCPLLRKKVRAGHLGKKSGQGFYNYE